MTRLTLLNAAAAAASLALSVVFAMPPPGTPHPRQDRPAGIAASSRVVHENGTPGLRDAKGRFVPLADYRRILSTSFVSDSLLLALAEPDRVVAFSEYAASGSPHAWRLAGKPSFAGLADIEAALALRPDLVLVNDVGASDRSARLREVGLEVFDLGEMRGLASLLPNVEAVATLLGRPEEGRRLARHFARRMARLAGDVPEAERPTGVYVAVYGDSLLGGTTGTSFHDVLTAAGIRDAAADRYEGWPRYGAESLLELDPDLIITQTGMARALCAYPGLDRLRACDPATGRIVEIDGVLIATPSLAMLEAAEALRDALERAPPSRGPAS